MWILEIYTVELYGVLSALLSGAESKGKGRGGDRSGLKWGAPEGPEKR